MRRREKNSLLNRGGGGGERGADKNGNRGGENKFKFKSSSKEGTCSSSLFNERGLCLKIIFISGVHNERTDPGTGYSWAPAPPPLDPSLELTRRPLNLNVCNRLFMIKTTDQHCHNFVYYIFNEFFSWYSKIWTTTHPFIELICSPLLLLAYTRFSVWSRLLSPEKNNDFCFMSSLLHLNRRDFTKVPRYVCSTC